MKDLGNEEAAQRGNRASKEKTASLIKELRMIYIHLNSRLWA